MGVPSLIRTLFLFVLFATVITSSAFAQKDASGCTDPQLFNRMPGHYLERCPQSPFEMRRFPVGPLGADGSTKLVELEGQWRIYAYLPLESATKASPLQIQRNFQNAAKAAGGTVEGSYPEWCKFQLDASFKLGNSCTESGTTLKFTKDGKETWVFVDATAAGQTGYRDGYTLYVLERAAMTQDIVANELLDKINKDGMVALYLNFETGSATLQASSNSQIDQIAAMLKSNAALTLEVAGHTDNAGAADANQKLSEARAAAVVQALAARGVAASRLSAKGYGATQPIADNRTEDGRGKNRRVELVRK
jgi:OOP family OmpA-OmpF porin